MIRQILTDLTQETCFEPKTDGILFHIPTERQYATDNVLWLLKFLGISARQGKSETIHIPDIIKFNELQNALNQEKQTVYALSGRFAKYNDLTENDWNTFERYIRIRAFDEEENPTHDEEVNARKKFFDFLRQKFAISMAAYRFLHEFNEIFSELKDKKLTVDCSASAEKICADNQSYAESIAPLNLILLSADDGQICPENIADFFHELRHIIQYHYNLFTNEWEDVPAYKDFVEVLAIEAETTAFDLVSTRKDYSFLKKIFATHQKRLEKALFDDLKEVPVNPNTSIAQKIAALIRFINADTEEKSIHTIAQCHLGSSRNVINGILKKEGIRLSPEEFNTFCELIDDWKNCYFAMPVEIEKFSEHFNYNQSEIKATEDNWLDKVGLSIKLSPRRIFSPRMAHCFNLYEQIYGSTDFTRTPAIQCVYRDISAKLIIEAGKCVVRNDMDKIRQIYEFVQKKNPFLPDYQTIASPSLTPKQLYKAFKTMYKGLMPKTVLQAIGYHTENIFENRFIHYINRQRLKKIVQNVKQNTKE